MRKVVIAFIAMTALVSCSKTPGAAESATDTESPTTTTTMAMTDDQATARACSIYAETENRVTLASAGLRDHSGGPDDARKRTDAYHEANRQWLPGIAEALAIVPNNRVFTAMSQAPAFYLYWVDTGKGPDAGAGAYGYSQVLADVINACASAGHPLDLITEPHRPGLPN